MHYPKQETIAVVLIYIFMLAGGLWHALDILQAEMRLLASPMIIGLGLLLFGDYLRNLHFEKTNSKAPGEGLNAKQAARRFVVWSILVVLFGFLIELAGVKTGVVFGRYRYGGTLQPALAEVPLAIGFAWLAMLLCSGALTARVLSHVKTPNLVLQAGVIAGFMLLFDFFMEPAAMKLNYWQWQDGTVPPRNYLAWFVTGYALAFSGLRTQFWRAQTSIISVHAYIAQLGYFSIVNLAK